MFRVKNRSYPILSLAASVLAAAVLTVTFLAAVRNLATRAGQAHATAAGVTTAILIGGTACMIPFVALALVTYTLVALCARAPRR